MRRGKLDDNTAIVRRWFREVYTGNGEATIDQLVAREATGWMEGRALNGPEGFKAARQRLLDVFPDLVLTVDDIIEQDGKVAARWNVHATHGGPGLGVPVTNRRVSFRGMTWLELRDGRIACAWDNWNLGGLILTLMESAGPPEK
jgi:steroid delta-isomerase-like uncharacterized protein